MVYLAWNDGDYYDPVGVLVYASLEGAQRAIQEQLYSPSRRKQPMVWAETAPGKRWESDQYYIEAVEPA